MAVTWGSGSGSGYGVFYVGIDYSVSGTTATVRYYVRTEANSVSDSQTLTLSGMVSGTVNFSMTTPNMGAQLVATRTFTGSRGSSYSVTAKLSGTYSGATPSHSRSIPIPAAVPGKAGTPSVSSITSSSWSASTSAPANNGASISGYQWQWATNSGFTSGTGTTTSSGTSRSFSGFSANEQYWLRVRAENSVGYGAWSSAQSFTTLPAVPAAPTSVTAARNSDTSHTVTWTRAATSAAPYTTQRVQRWSASTNAWTTIATVSGTYTSGGNQSYTDTGTAANGRYRYRVYASNSSGNSGYGTSAYFYTTPGTATAVTAAKNSAGNIVVSWTSGATYPTRWEVWHAANGTWDASRLTLTTEGTVTYTHTSPNASVTHTYRVRPVQGSLTGSYSPNSAVVQLQAPPLAPTLLEPANGSTLPDDADVTFTWSHNPVDTTPQTAAEIEIDGTPYAVADEESYTTSLPSYTTSQWRVRTKGAHASYGPWSALRTVSVAPRPVVSIEDPATDVSRLTAEWDVDQTSSAWEAVLVTVVDEEEVTLEERNGTDGMSTTFETALNDDTQYTIRVRAFGDYLWSDWADTTWTTDFPVPDAPSVTLEYDPESGAVNVFIDNPDTEPVVTSNRVLRRLPEGEWETLVTDLPVNAIWADTTALIGGVTEYRVEAWTDLPTNTATEATIETPAEHKKCFTFLSGGDSYQTVCRVRGHVLDRTPQVEYASHAFAGRTKLFTVWGANETLDATFKGGLQKDSSTAEDFTALQRMRGPVLYRDCQGRRIFGTLTALSVSQDLDKQSISFTVSESE